MKGGYKAARLVLFCNHLLLYYEI